MGQSHQKIVRVLVVGLSGMGKTHFLDMFNLGEDTIKMPTLGRYETSIRLESSDTYIHLVEYGAQSVHAWLKYNRNEEEYHAIYLVVCSNATPEQLCESKNLVCSIDMLSHLPLVVIYNVRGGGMSFEKRNKALQLGAMTGHRRVSAVDLKFDNSPTFANRVAKVFEWTRGVPTKIV